MINVINELFAADEKRDIIRDPASRETFQKVVADLEVRMREIIKEEVARELDSFFRKGE